MQKQELSTLSLARRAGKGKLVLGFDKVVEEMRAGKVKGVFYSADLSGEKAARSFCLCGTKILPAAHCSGCTDGGDPAGLRQTLGRYSGVR